MDKQHISLIVSIVITIFFYGFYWSYCKLTFHDHEDEKLEDLED